MSGPDGQSIHKGTNMSNSSVNPQMLFCMTDRDSFAAFSSYLLAFIILPLPMFALVGHVALQRWRSRKATATCNLDMLTYHMVLLELLGLAGACVYYHGSMTRTTPGWTFLLVFIGVDQALFHLLACMDRYLAVVHPVRYMWLRQSAGIRLRNVAIGFCWLLGMPACTMGNKRGIYNFFILFFSLLFSTGTLCALFVISHLGPKRESKEKQRALHTVAAITATLVLRSLGNLIPFILHTTMRLNQRLSCLVASVFLPAYLPSSLVMPLLFLQRAGKLPNCQNTSKSEKEESS